MKYSFRVVVILLLVLLSYLPYTPQAIASEKEVIVNGDFENGMVNLEIYRYPVYPDVKNVARSISNAISGQYSLELPHVYKGGYKFVLPMLLLTPKDSTEVGAKVHAKKPVSIIIEGFVQKKRVFTEKIRLKKNQHQFLYSLPSGILSENPTPVSIILWVRSNSSIMLDDISLKTTGIYSDTSGIQMSSSKPLGVYGIDEKGWVHVTGERKATKYTYRIYNHLMNKVIDKGFFDLDNDQMIDLYTKKRGSYRVEILKNNGNTDEIISWRLYAVINKDNANTIKGGRYGIALEEHGGRQMLNAMLEPEEWYVLTSQIGAGNVRLFTAAMPDLISKDGFHYDFTASDSMLNLSEQYYLEPLVELGSNRPDRMPKWLLSSEISKDNFNLFDGIRTKKLKKKYLKKNKDYSYFNSDPYKDYLQKIMTHFGDRVHYYEIWNEPGHKFKPEDFFKVAALTRDAQMKYAKHASIVGFTSTKGAGLGNGINIGLVPEFASEMMRFCSNCIDILSYHSEHAFLFLGDSIDHRNEETGFVDRLTNMLKGYPNRVNMPIWDTERGIKWYSPHTERIDYMAGADSIHFKRAIVSVNEVARRLPGVHAAAFASGVEKLFWFNMSSGAQTSVRSHGRFSFFDADLEPMPHLPVYDAMTEMIADAEYVKLLDRPDGTRVYEFKRQESNVSILLAYNWKEVDSVLSIRHNGAAVEIKDIFGETTSNVDSSTAELNIDINGWPQYILINNTSQGVFSMQ